MLLKDNISRRIFLAISAPEEIHTYLEFLKTTNSHLPKIKWMRLHNLHVTIYFIGSIKTETFEEVLNVIQKIVKNQLPFELDFDRICLSPENKPRMIWARYHRNKSFSSLSNYIHDGLIKLIPSNKFFYNDPVPHITLARFHPLKNLTGFKMESNPVSHKIVASKCELWESIKIEGRSHYKCIQSFDFQ